MNRLKLFPFFDPQHPENMGYDHFFDCQMELYILNLLVKYIKKNNIKYETDVSKISKHISDSIFKGRNLFSENVDVVERKKGIIERQYIDGKPTYVIED